MLLILTWKQFDELAELVGLVQRVKSQPLGELKSSPSTTTVEWDETTVKILITEE